MAHEEYRNLQDVGKPGVFIFKDATSLMADASLTFTRNAAGDYSLDHAAGAATVHIVASFGEQDMALLMSGAAWRSYLQEQFGGTTGAGPAQYPGRPPIRVGRHAIHVWDSSAVATASSNASSERLSTYGYMDRLHDCGCKLDFGCGYCAVDYV